ncbi:hypothetical protein ACXR2W_00400 [Leucobacter sp. HY1908]
MSTATFTDLLRRPKEVLARINEEQVRITRRDGDDLVILRGHDLDVLESGVALSSQLIRAIHRNSGNVEVALTELFAWANDFKDSELTEYATEIESLLYSASELGSFERLLRVQTEWRETAAAYAMDMTPTDPVEFTDPPRRAPRP